MIFEIALLSVLVHSGDTLSGIAASHGESLAVVEALNPQFSANYNLIYPGQRVYLKPWRGQHRRYPGATTRPAARAVNYQGYANPLGPGYIRERTDMGVDFGGAFSLYALGSGTVASTYNSGWPGGTFIVIRMYSGRAVYYAEDISCSAWLGEHVRAGQYIGRAYGGSSGIEIGWADPSGDGNTEATDLGEGSFPTWEGLSMAGLLTSLGVR